MSTIMFSTFGQTLFMCIYYEIVGALAIAVNILSICAFANGPSMRKRYFVYIALECAQMVNALSFILTGSGRMTALLEGTIDEPITSHQCFYERYWVHSLILGTELPTLIIIVISLERICAVAQPALYRSLFDGWHNKACYVTAACLLAGLSVGMAAISAYNDDTLVNRTCPIVNATALWYSTLHFSFLVLGYTQSFASLLIVYYQRQAYRYKTHQPTSHDTRILVLILHTGMSILLVSMPSVVMIGMGWQVWYVNDLFTSLVYSLTAWVSIASAFLNYCYHQDYRRSLSAFFCSWQIHHVDSAEHIEHIEHS